jgi:hypothetical protein
MTADSDVGSTRESARVREAVSDTGRGGTSDPAAVKASVMRKNENLSFGWPCRSFGCVRRASICDVGTAFGPVGGDVLPFQRDAPTR